MSRAKIKGQEYPIQEVFSSHFIYEVPLYQRPYTWKKEQAMELLKGLLDSMGDDNNSSSDQNSYFMGSIVLIKEDDITKPRSQIVDGQQRLVTLTILLSILRNFYKEDEDIAANLTDFIVQKGKPLQGIPDQYRLTLREEDEQFFKDYIQTYGKINKLINSDLTICKTDSQKNIQINAKFLYETLNLKSKKEIERLARFITNQTYLVTVSTPDSDSAYRIFSILNDTGLDLSHTDILKSEIIGKIPKDQQKNYARLWNETEDKLGRNAFGDLFYHIRMIKHPEKLRKDILNEFRKLVSEKPGSDPRQVIEDIVKYSDVYDSIRKEEYQSSNGAEEINKNLSWLNRIDNRDWIPPAISYALDAKDPDDLNRFLIDLERLAAGLMICRADINERIKRYGEILEKIGNSGNLFEETSPLQLSSEERDKIAAKLNGNLYLETQFRLYVLLRLDDAFSDGGAEYNYKIVTIEHVLPQTLGDDWGEFEDPSVHEKYVHQLGNLVLLTRKMQPKARNFGFAKKKEVYFKKKDGSVSFQLTRQVVDETEWTPEVIDRRQKELLQKLKEIWRL